MITTDSQHSFPNKIAASARHPHHFLQCHFYRSGISELIETDDWYRKFHDAELKSSNCVCNEINRAGYRYKLQGLSRF